MIKINNVPVGYQHIFDGEEVFILLHKLIESGEYQNFYLNPNRNFSLIILDNSCFELGESLDSDLLLEWAYKLKKAHPHTKIEVIIPDSYGDKNKTMLLARGFLELEEEIEPFNLMAIPQGKDERELIECLIEMLSKKEITCIGLNKLWDKKTLEQIIPMITIAGKEIHRLGVNNLSDWVLYNSDMVRSTDSRILSKIVTGVEDPWDEKLDNDKILILQRLIDEVQKW